MKQGIHPTFYNDAVVVCACGNTWTTGSTRKSIHTEVCSKCHPFFTGQQARLLDVEGQVDRFYRKLQARQSFVDQQKARDESRTSLEKTVAELELGTAPPTPSRKPASPGSPRSSRSSPRVSRPSWMWKVLAANR